MPADAISDEQSNECLRAEYRYSDYGWIRHYDVWHNPL